MKKLNTEEFIKKAIKKHGDKYDYSLVKYITSRKKITIVCKEHGVFEQEANAHLQGYGCIFCSRRKQGGKFTTEKFIERARKVHGDKYGYSLVIYKDMHTKVKIVCPKHGIFEQKPNGHINNKQGCSKCSGKYKPTTKEFIEKAREIHGDRYDYSLVEYKNNYTKIKIICPEHGEFEQKPNHHINGFGCSGCSESIGEKEVASYLYDNNIEFERQHKFNGCKNKKELSFDFYIPLMNMCIEYDGEQHFRPIEFFGGEEKFKKQVINDKIKTKYCQDNSINLIRIRFDQNVNKVLGGTKLN